MCRPGKQLNLLNHMLPTIQQSKKGSKRKRKTRSRLFARYAKIYPWKYTRYARAAPIQLRHRLNCGTKINPDGHCLFSAVADQLILLEVLSKEQATYTNLRIAAANFIHSHPTDFIPFLPSAGGEDGEGALDAGFMNRQQFDGYCTMVRDTAVWGGEPEIVALSKAFNLPIHVVQGSQPFVVVHDPTGHQTHTSSKVERVVRISYHRKLYGLGEVSEHFTPLHLFVEVPPPHQHYNSLRPIYKISQA